MEEIWKDIPEYEGMYQISNLGNVKSLKRKFVKEDKILKTVTHKDGYLHVGLYKNKTRKENTNANYNEQKNCTLKINKFSKI